MKLEDMDVFNLGHELGYLDDESFMELNGKCDRVIRMLSRLVASMK